MSFGQAMPASDVDDDALRREVLDPREVVAIRSKHRQGRSGDRRCLSGLRRRRASRRPNIKRMLFARHPARPLREDRDRIRLGEGRERRNAEFGRRADAGLAPLRAGPAERES